MNVDKATKAENGGGVTSQLPKVEQMMDPRADLMGQRAAFKTELPHLYGRGANQTELLLNGTTAATW
jgi:hypothetical protein